MQNIIYIALAILGLNFLIFIHELGHYIVARRNGIKVEVFSIGFGKPLVSWMRKGVKWQICPIFFGGFVRVAGADEKGILKPEEVPNGYYSKTPWVRIKFAVGGPIANLLFAFFTFFAVWFFGGREKPFSQFTQIIGFIDPHSELYQKGVQPGDCISEYNGKRFGGYQDLIYAAFTNGRLANLEGVKINYFTQEKIPYDYTLAPYESPFSPKGIKTVGILAPASYLIYQNAIYQNLPISKSGIECGDRIVWVNGEIVFSNEQLGQILNGQKVLFTIERDGQIFLGKIPRVLLTDLCLSQDELAEIEDWQYAAGLCEKKENYEFVPYHFSHTLEVEKDLYYLDKESKMTRASLEASSPFLDTLLLPGDRILAVNGIRVNTPVELLKELQLRRVQIIVQRSKELKQVSWKEEDQTFLRETEWNDLLPIVSTIGRQNPVTSNGDFYLLTPVTLTRLKDFPMSEKESRDFEEALKKEILSAKKITKSDERQQALHYLNRYKDRFALGALFMDRIVNYNPNPWTLFQNGCQEILYNLKALVTGSVSPKQFGGPIFVMQVMQQSWNKGFKEALFWLGAISLNLGILNLIPIPFFDGGRICFSIFESIRGKPFKQKTMQWIMIPFILLVLFLFLYLTFNDIGRMLTQLF